MPTPRRWRSWNALPATSSPGPQTLERGWLHCASAGRRLAAAASGSRRRCRVGGPSHHGCSRLDRPSGRACAGGPRDACGRLRTHGRGRELSAGRCRGVRLRPEPIGLDRCPGRRNPRGRSSRCVRQLRRRKPRSTFLRDYTLDVGRHFRSELAGRDSAQPSLRAGHGGAGLGPPRVRRLGRRPCGLPQRGGVLGCQGRRPRLLQVARPRGREPRCHLQRRQSGTDRDAAARGLPAGSSGEDGRAPAADPDRTAWGHPRRWRLPRRFCAHRKAATSPGR